MRFLLISSVVLSLFVGCLATGQQKRTAIVLQNKKNMKKTHSKYFQQLKESGHEISFYDSERDSVELKIYGERVFENLIIFAPNANQPAHLSKENILEFMDKGGNLLVASSKKLSKMLRSLAADCGVTYGKKGTMLLDHFSYEKDTEKVLHSTITTQSILRNPFVVGHELAQDKNSKHVVFRGLAQYLEPTNVLAFKVLTPSLTAYSAIPTKKITDKILDQTGSEIALVSAVQARNNARAIFSGSLTMFSNDFFAKARSSNQEFCKHISLWTFQESGVLRVTNIHHHRQDGSPPEKMLHDVEKPDQPITLYPDAEIARDSLVYRIKDNLTYSFDIHQLTPQNNWVPYKAEDVQLEFVMLDPYVRKTMSHDNRGHYKATIVSPDQYGIFQFRIMYRRVGLTTLHFTTQVSVRPYKHDEYERFIVAAFPYYASAFSMMFGVFIFSFLFLYTKE